MFSKNPLPIFISFLPNNLIGYVTESNGSYDCHKPIISSIKCSLGSFYCSSLNQHPFSKHFPTGAWTTSIFLCAVCLNKDMDADYVHPCSRSTIGSFWYDFAWQRTIQDATVCHSTEIEELISLHQSPAFYKYSKALCSLSPSLSFSFLAAFSVLPLHPSPSLPPLCLSMFFFFFPTHTPPPTSSLFPLLLSYTVEKCVSCLSRKRQ